MRVGDYLAAEDFVHDDLADSLASGAGLRDFIAAPIIGDAGPFGAIEVFSRQPNVFDDIDEAVLGGLADQAAIAITNARLIEELEKSRKAVARRADTERSLRDITARIAALREPDVILDRVVEEAARLLGTDGAHLTRMSDDGTYLVPVVVAGGADFATQAWLLGMRFPLGGGINGLAAQSREPVSTFDYLVDPRIPHDPDDTEVADRLALRGMAAAPLRAPGGEVIGTLAVSSAQPRAFQPEELDLLQGLADQAAIAITNSNLLTRLASSEERYRYLVENAPDLVWSIDGEGRFTFLSDAVERLTGRGAEAFLGKHFGALVHGTSRDVAEYDFAAGMTSGAQELRGRVNLEGPDGEPVPAEFIATARLDEDGRFAGANGSVRDMRERDRLERELRESEERYRFLVENSPDVVFATDADGQFTYLSEAIERLTGYAAGRAHRQALLGDRRPDDDGRGRRALGEARSPTRPPSRSSELILLGKDDRQTAVEVHALGIVADDGSFAGIHGSTRDISERERLQRELRSSEERYRYLVSSSPDLVWVTDAAGQLVFVSEAAETILGTSAAGADRAPVLGGLLASRHGARPRSASSGSAGTPPRSTAPGCRSGTPTATTSSSRSTAIGMVEDGRFVGAHGAARDVSERDRLERDLRRQAGELAAGEERAHLARELHDSVTQALFSMTLVSRSVELLLDRDPDAARTQLDPAARAPARGARRDARADLRAAARQPRAGRPRPRAQDPHGVAAGPDRAAGRRRERRSRSGCRCPSRRRSTGSPRRRSTTSSSTPARTQVRVEVGRTASGVRLRIERRRQGLRPGPRPGRPPRPRRDAGARRADRRDVHRARARSARARRSRSWSGGPGERRSRTRASGATPSRRRSATDDVGGAPSFGRGGPRQASVPRPWARPRPWVDARPRARDRRAAPRPRRRCGRSGPREPDGPPGDRAATHRRRRAPVSRARPSTSSRAQSPDVVDRRPAPAGGRRRPRVHRAAARPGPRRARRGHELERRRRAPGARGRRRRVRPQDLPPERPDRGHRRRVRPVRRLTGRRAHRALIDSTALADARRRDMAPQRREIPCPSPTPIRVLIVDDHSVVRTGLRVFLDLQPDIEVVGEAADGSEGVAVARRLEPDVVLMDLLMPNMDGITAIGRIKAERPETEIVTMTSFIEEEKVTAALEAGASGYVLKDAEAEEVAAAIRAAYAGEVHLDPAVARLLAQRMRNRKSPDDELAEPLTEREKDVLRLLGQGMSNKEIGVDAVHHRADGPDLRLEHPGQARARVADAGGAVRGRAQARLDARRTRRVSAPVRGRQVEGSVDRQDPVADAAARGQDRDLVPDLSARGGPPPPVTPTEIRPALPSASAPTHDL